MGTANLSFLLGLPSSQHSSKEFYLPHNDLQNVTSLKLTTHMTLKSKEM
jgi:hypothetical protein